MSNGNHLLEVVLRECQRKAPAPFYPSLDARDKGFDRAALDQALDQLRLGGLIRLTPWEAGHGQGYTLTPEGQEVVQSPRLLSRLQTQGVETRRAEALPANTPSDGRDMTPWGRGEAVRAILTGGGTPIVTMTIIIASVFVFFLGMAIAGQNNIPANEYLSGNSARLTGIYDMLGSVNRNAVVQEDAWWRLIAHQFVHIGFIHLLLNMFFLFNVGQILETMWGHVRFLILYLLSGIGGGVAVVLADHGSNVSGASGALCGIFASMAVWIIWNRAHLPPQVVSNSLRQLMLNAIIIGVISFMPRVSGTAHLGGAIAGAIVSVPLMYTRFGNAWQRWLGWLGVIAMPIVCVLLIQNLMTEDDRAQAALEKMRTADKHATFVFANYLEDLLNAPKKIIGDAKRTREAKQHLKEATEHLQDTIAKLQATAPFKDEKNRQQIKDAIDYLEGWKTVFDSSTKCLDSKDGGSPEERHRIIEQMEPVITLSDKFFGQRFKR